MRKYYLRTRIRVKNQNRMNNKLYRSNKDFWFAGVCGGIALVDDCGTCTAGTTGLEINYLMDCKGACNGDAYFNSAASGTDTMLARVIVTSVVLRQEK